MQNLVNDLYVFTGRELHEAAWTANLPLHHGVALHSFFNGFHTHGDVIVELDDRGRSATFNLPINVGKSTRTFTTQLSYNQILEGWKNSFKASPRSLYDSIYQVYNQIEDKIKREDRVFFDSEELDWHTRFRETDPRRIRKFMEYDLLEYFGKYHEGILIPPKEDCPRDFQEPRVFWETLRDFPLGKLHMAVVANEVDNSPARMGPCPEYILETPEEEFDINTYYPSESALMDVFWGMYLQRLAESKGYSALEDDISLRHFIVRGNAALRVNRA